jgi:hypothetical protein
MHNENLYDKYTTKELFEKLKNLKFLNIDNKIIINPLTKLKKSF